MGNLLPVATGILLLATVAYLGDQWQSEEALGSIACHDEDGVWDVPDGLILGGPLDNTHEEPYASWVAACPEFVDQVQAATVEPGNGENGTP